jgi:FeS assembly SUF system protein
MQTPYTEAQIISLGEDVVRALKTIYDPEIPVDIYELGLIYDVQISTEGAAEVLMTLTTPNCPAAEILPAEVETKTAKVEGIVSANVTLTFEPTWTKDNMSEEAKFELGML